jgi:hypothetical protein
VAGDRFPWMQLRFDAGGPAEDLFQKLDDTSFNLLVFGAPSIPPAIEDEFGDLLHVHAIPQGPDNDAELARAGVPQPSFYLLRPDGHVGLCGPRLEVAALERYLSGQVRLDAGASRAEKAAMTPA